MALRAAFSSFDRARVILSIEREGTFAAREAGVVPGSDQRTAGHDQVLATGLHSLDPRCGSQRATYPGLTFARL